MKIAIIGKGLSGLACAYFLKNEGVHVEVFYDQNGASCAASGLVHPYPGDRGEKAFFGDEAYEEVKSLFLSLENPENPFAFEEGFLKKSTSILMQQNLDKAPSCDIEKIDEDLFFIKKGIRLDTPKYLKALEEVCLAKGVVFCQKRISDLLELREFDRIWVCAGYGIKDLQKDLKLKYLKGQSFVFDKKCQHKKGFFSKGYLVPFGEKVIIGSTYERTFSTEGPNYQVAHQIMKENMDRYFPQYRDSLPIEIHAGVRVAHPNYNTPKWIIKDQKVAFLTGLGSRGLLYHASWAKMAALYYTDLKKMPDFYWQDCKKSNH